MEQRGTECGRRDRHRQTTLDATPRTSHAPRMPVGSARSVPKHGTSLPAVSLNPVSLLWPPSSSVLEGVTNTSRKVIPRSHLQLAASPPGPTLHTHRVSSRDQRPAQAQRRSPEGNSPTGESKESGRPSGPDTGGPTEEAWVGQSQSPLHLKGWREGRPFSLFTSQDSPLLKHPLCLPTAFQVF